MFTPGGGRHVAISGARNSVQVVSTAEVTSGAGHVDTETVVTSGQRLVGHTGDVTSVAWSRCAQWLVSAGTDQVSK